MHWSAPDAAPRLWSADAALGEELAAELAAAADRERTRERAVAPRLPPAETARPGDLTFAEYSAKFAAARAALARGDSYQLCFTFPIVRPSGDPGAAAHVAQRENPAPFAAHVEGPFGAIASSSPERFLSVDARGRVEARPMKGTAARPDDLAERTHAARELVASQKMRAENFMIADLLRNDLGRVCRIGSVRATKAALLEETATLLQLVSVIEGELAPGRTRADLLASAFPPGSMTGAPKTRSVELLRALEAGPRGPYAGALGYWSADGRVDLSVVIRTLLLARGTARVQVGSGIVWDSEVEAEYAECLAKAAAPLAALAVRAVAGRRVRILVVDHQDSFTWNLVHAFGARGERPRSSTAVRSTSRASRAPPDLLVLEPRTGPSADPAASGRTLELLRALPPSAPLFGVCFGLELLAVHAGGRVVAARDPVHGKMVAVRHDGHALFDGVASGTPMMRYHSLVADGASLRAPWRPIAWSPRDEVMALAADGRPAWAVQFHPESIGSPDGPRLLENVLRLARGA